MRPIWIATAIAKAIAWDAQPRVEKTDANPHGNPPVTCVHCQQSVPWPDREGCDYCGGYLCAVCHRICTPCPR